MPTDDLYLENLDELVLDENKVVTYKSLSYMLKVQCNVAKQMLFAFLTRERKKKGEDVLSATYFISGLTKPDSEGSQVFKCIVTQEEKVEEWKKSFAVVTSCHLYSVQKSKLKDSNPLYMSDYEKFKEDVFDCNRYSSIQYDKAKPRSDDDMDLLMLNVPATEADKRPSTVKSTEASGSSKTQTKKGNQSAIANMFSKVDNKKKPPSKEEKAVKQESEKKESHKEPPKGGKKGGGGMMGFLSKQTDTKQANAGEKEKTKDSKPANVKKEPSPAPSKKSQRKEDSDDEDIFRKKKRRRTKTDIFESSSEEEEEMEAQPESPVPEKEKSPEPEVIEDEEEEPVASKQPSPTKESGKREITNAGDSGGQRKRRRKRKLVPKTYLDKDGFMVTEKVWESDSTDASEAEEPVKKAALKIPTPEKGKNGSPKKKSPAKKGQHGSGKQTSLMSFFKKS